MAMKEINNGLEELMKLDVEKQTELLNKFRSKELDLDTFTKKLSEWSSEFHKKVDEIMEIK